MSLNTQPSTLNLTAPREILIIKPSSLGDVVHTLPSAVALRRAFPGAKIRWLVNTEWKPLLDGLGQIDEAIEFPRRDFRGARGLLRIAPWARALRERVNADLVLDYQGLLRSALMAKLCRGSEARVIGLSDAREGARFFYDEAVDVSGCQHAVDRYLALTNHAIGLGGAGAPSHASGGGATGADLLIEWPLPEGKPPANFPANDSFVVLHPFSRGTGKSLSIEQVTEFCASLAPQRVVIAGRSDVALPAMENVVDLLNRTDLHELIWLLRQARFVVSVDSGPMHIAAALTNRLVSIHTWSDPAKVGPYRPEAWVWQAGRLFQQKDREKSAVHREVANMSLLAEFVKTQLCDSPS